jgi:hypothetical protein
MLLQNETYFDNHTFVVLSMPNHWCKQCNISSGGPVTLLRLDFMSTIKYNDVCGANGKYNDIVHHKLFELLMCCNHVIQL